MYGYYYDRRTGAIGFGYISKSRRYSGYLGRQYHYGYGGGW